MKSRIAMVVVVVASAIAAGAGLQSSESAVRPSLASCPRGQADVTLGGKSSCQPLASAFPRPSGGDLRLLTLQALFDSDWSGLPDLKGRRAPSLHELLDKLGPNVYATAKRSLPRLLAMIDRLRPSKPRTLQGVSGRSASTAAAGAAPCRGPGGSPKTDSKTLSGDNGSSFDLHTTVGDTITAGFGIQGPAKDGSGRTERWDFDTDLCDKNSSFTVPECPTAAGVVDASGDINFTVTFTSLRNKEVELQVKLKYAHKVKLHGQVADDAKLDTVHIDDTYRQEVASGRQSILWGPSSEKGTVHRETTIDMRTGRYDLGKASVADVSVSYTGILSIFTQDAVARARVAAELEKSSNKTFAKVVEDVIKEYRGREAGWNKPNTCTTLRFSPAPNSLTLRQGQSGSFTGQVAAKLGGTPNGRWKRTQAKNGTFSPASAEGLEPRFTYTVTRGGAPVSASFHVTSKAGVAEDIWSQNTPRAPLRWTGRISSSQTAKSSDGQQTVTAAAKLTLRADTLAKFPAVTYSVESGTVAFELRGVFGADCRANATGTYPLKKTAVTLWADYSRPDAISYLANNTNGAGLTFTITRSGGALCVTGTSRSEIAEVLPCSYWFITDHNNTSLPQTWISSEPRQLEGSATYTEGSRTCHFEWSFSAR